MEELLETAEEQENNDALVNLFIIYKSILSLGESKVIETMLSNDHFMGTFGALECNFSNYHLLDDPEVLSNQEKSILEE